MTISRYPPLSEYALVSDSHSAALIGRSGSIDWMCLPRFDGRAVFARLLDWDRGGHFSIEVPEPCRVSRCYTPDTNVLETTFECETGTAVLMDFMPVHPHPTPVAPTELVERERLIRLLRCTRGRVRWQLTCKPRFDYGTFIPHVGLLGPCLGHAHGGPEGLTISTSSPMTVVDDAFEAFGELRVGETAHAILRYDPRYLPQTQAAETPQLLRWLDATRRHWQDWASHGAYDGPDRDQVVRSALVLKALTYEPSGAIVAAPTTSLPERIGGALNWDYRFTWLRDASLALSALFRLGYSEEAQAFLQWLDWTAVGRARDLQLVYGIGGERRLSEHELPELEGWRGSKPVRIGNLAHAQFQLDVFGELLDAVHEGHRFTGELRPDRWQFFCRVANLVSDRWREPDEGIWETRGGRRHHVHSKVMAWVAVDRALRLATERSLPGDVKRWAQARDEIRADVLANGFSEERGAYVQAYGEPVLDAAVLQMPLVGFLPASDPRMASTIRAIERELSSPQGLVWRNEMHGPLGSEGTFLACTFWLVENLALLGDLGKARSLFDRARRCANDVGLFAEEVDARSGELLGNFPQAFSHLGHVLAAVRLHAAETAASSKRPSSDAAAGRGKDGDHAAPPPIGGAIR